MISNLIESKRRAGATRRGDAELMAGCAVLHPPYAAAN